MSRVCKNRLREIRMTQYQEEPKEFAARLKSTPSAYYQWELGTSFPKLAKALEISEILDIDVNEIWYLN